MAVASRQMNAERVDLIVGAAMQVVEGRTLRLHAMAIVEHLGPNVDERPEVWREVREAPLGNVEIEVRQILERLVEGLGEAKAAFDSKADHL